ncbi:MAG TPA: nicotinate phosphoribosyltransferase [Terriglobales bacterium]|nr:nicotinate phosphoribosyltransferase [Terriglobales bacterium]
MRPSIYSSSVNNSALQTDLYELTMAAAYFENGLNKPATFELFIRSLPDDRGYLIAAGLEQAIEYLETFHFDTEQIDFLRSQSVFANVSHTFFDYLSSVRFTGEVWAVEEGTPVFPSEPLLRITAPAIEAQLAETYLLSVVTFETSIATKAARCVHSAQGRPVLEFGSRRAHGPDAAVLAARAAYIGGCAGSSNVEAGRRFGTPMFGTLAHSFVSSYEREEDSFRDFARVFPNDVVILLDTYDTLAAIDKIASTGLRPSGVRLDSGDLVALAKEVRRRLDQHGLQRTKIVGSSDLDEHAIRALLAAGAPIDVFGVGTALATSNDAPALGGVYKLVEFDGQPRGKLSESRDKISYPGRKQVFRFTESGRYSGDVIALEGQDHPDGQPLLVPVMRAGKSVRPSLDLAHMRARTMEQIATLPEDVLRLRDPAKYRVSISPDIQHMLEEVRRRFRNSDRLVA